MTRSLSFIVLGKPAPQGSKRHVGHGIMVESSPRARTWRDAVRIAAADAAADAGWGRTAGPVQVRIDFYFDKPKSAPKNRETWPITRSSGDVDKLARAVLDAIVQAGVIVDDSQVVHLEGHKWWTTENPKIATPCAWIGVYEVPA